MNMYLFYCSNQVCFIKIYLSVWILQAKSSVVCVETGTTMQVWGGIKKSSFLGIRLSINVISVGNHSQQEATLVTTWEEHTAFTSHCKTSYGTPKCSAYISTSLFEWLFFDKTYLVFLTIVTTKFIKSKSKDLMPFLFPTKISTTLLQLMKQV